MIVGSIGFQLVPFIAKLAKPKRSWSLSVGQPAIGRLTQPIHERQFKNNSLKIEGESNSVSPNLDLIRLSQIESRLRKIKAESEAQGLNAALFQELQRLEAEVRGNSKALEELLADIRAVLSKDHN